MRAHVAVLCLLAGAVVIVPAPAAAADRTPTPSARELWRTYPLQTDPPATPTAAAPERRASAPAAPAPDDRPPAVLLAPVGAGILALAAGFLVLRRRAGARSAVSDASALLTAPTAVTVVAATALSDRSRRSPRLTTLAEAGGGREAGPALRPPDPQQAWTLEIEWRDAGDGPRFCALARRDDGGAEAPITSSAGLEWPPADPDAVRRMRETVVRLERALLAAGWTPLPAGSSWYSKRFAWVPAPATVKTDRFARASEWPPDTEVLWRCEIEWKGGYVNSRFRAVSHAPGRRKGMPIAASAVFKWLFMDAPDRKAPEYGRELRQLDERLQAAGWSPAGRGLAWYSHRYVWRHDEASPEPLEPFEPAPVAIGSD